MRLPRLSIVTRWPARLKPPCGQGQAGRQEGRYAGRDRKGGGQYAMLLATPHSAAPGVLHLRSAVVAFRPL